MSCGRYIRISKYPFNYPSIWLLILFMYFFVYLFKVVVLVSKIFYMTLIRVYPKYWQLTVLESVTIRDFTAPPPLWMIWFDFSPTSPSKIMKSETKRCHIGMRIFIQFCKLSVSSIPTKGITIVRYSRSLRGYSNGMAGSPGHENSPWVDLHHFFFFSDNAHSSNRVTSCMAVCMKCRK